PAAQSVAKSEQARFSCPRNFAVLSHILHRAAELILRDGWILSCNLPIGHIGQTRARQLAPVIDPIGTKAAVTVIDQSRNGGTYRRDWRRPIVKASLLRASTAWMS